MNLSQITILVLFSVLSFGSCCRTNNYYFPENGARAIAVLSGNYNGSFISGIVKFEQSKANESVHVSVNISGLPLYLGPKHGFHVHASAISVVSDNTSVVCGSALGHFNPLNKTHGANNASVRHIGDYGNLVRDSQGTIVTQFVDSVSELFGPLGIVGRTVVLHQLEDDLGLKNNSGSLATGNAGARLACGVIGLLP